MQRTRQNVRGNAAYSVAPRAAMTLIELLIVIVILATLTAAALPLLTPTTAERRIRETSRSFNTFLTQQQSKAIVSNRATGVALKRLSAETGNAADRGVCLEVVPVEVPVPYAGFDENSRMRVALNPNIPGQVLLDFITRNASGSATSGLPAGWRADLVPQALIRINDVVELKGTQYRILLGPDTSNMAIDPVNGYLGGNAGNLSQVVRLNAVPVNNTGQVIEPEYAGDGSRLTSAALRAAVASNNTGNGPFWTEPAPYKIHRQPVPTSADPFQLPEGAAIDLEASGIVGAVPFHYSDGDDVSAPVLYETITNAPVYILFSPEGNVERVQYERVQVVDNNGSRASVPVIGIPSANVALLVGRRELIPADTSLDLVSGTETEREAEKAKLNWLNLESRWVTIGTQSGSIVTTENAFVTPTVPTVDYDRNGTVDAAPDSLDTRMGQIQAAQEFAREMRRTTGG
ncbi:pilus assembly FimT family protein [Aeoliella sp.]|uniref:pilus assembly FimT family protein n=1 Tax=Aeoliella sp. TaxID=2795800 RepID=UPI003CCBEE90